MTIIRIKLDFSDVSDRDGIWMLIDETFTTINDVEKHIALRLMMALFAFIHPYWPSPLSNQRL